MDLLHRALIPVAQELNELDWKADLSPNKERLCQHLSAFANTPGGGFLIFGVANDGSVLGMKESRADEITNKLANLARQNLAPPLTIDAEVVPAPVDDRTTVLAIYIQESQQKPVHLRGKGIEESWFRTGGSTRRMQRQDIIRTLMNSRTIRFEEIPRSDIAGGADDFIDLDSAVTRLSGPPSSSEQALIDRGIDLGLLARTAGGIVPTNLGLLLAAKDFRLIPGQERQGFRITVYQGDTRLYPAQDFEFRRGILLSLDDVVKQVSAHVPVSEVIQSATRLQVPLWPIEALREAMVNAAAHRQYVESNAPVHVEIFPQRIEITSPGGLLSNQSVLRLLDQPPQSRNELLVDALRLAGLSEERGRGIDLMVSLAEVSGMPPPELSAEEASFRVVFLSPRPFSKMTMEQRRNAVYFHVALAYVSRGSATNATVRERFGLSATNSNRVTISRLLKDSLEAGLIKIADENASVRMRRYVPNWA